MKCKRCGAADRTMTVSTFTREMVCVICAARERNHPKYAEAEAAHIEAMWAGNIEFDGIGKPEDL